MSTLVAFSFYAEIFFHDAEENRLVKMQIENLIVNHHLETENLGITSANERRKVSLNFVDLEIAERVQNKFPPFGFGLTVELRLEFVEDYPLR